MSTLTPHRLSSTRSSNGFRKTPRGKPKSRVWQRFRPFVETLEDRVTPSATFDVIDFTQGANGDEVHSPPLGDTTWLNGILNPNNSELFEGMSTLQRVYIDGIVPTGDNVHTLTFSHQAEKGAQHAYDFLTSWDQAFAAAQAIAPGTLDDPYTDSSDANNIIEAYEPGSSSPAGFSTTLATLHGAANDTLPPNLGAAYYFDAQLPGGTKPGDTPMGDPSIGGNVDQKIDAYEAMFGNRTLRIFGDANITSASVSFLGYSGNAGNQSADYALTWTSASDMVVIEFGGHLAQGEDFTVPNVGYGTTAAGVSLGAGGISGGPYHIYLTTLDDGSTGSQDNQIQANAVSPPPSFTIEKTGDTISKPGDPVSFTVTITNDGGTDLTPDSITDSLVGTLNPSDFTESGTDDNILEKGESWTLTYPYTVQSGDPDPLVNTVDATFDFNSIEITHSASHSVDLFYPGIQITKTANDHLVAPGDSVTYTVTITNTTSNGPSGDGAPDLDITSVNDTRAGDLTSHFPDTLATGASASYTYTLVVPTNWDPAEDFDNTVTVESNPVGFPNDIDDSASESVNVFKPSITITKTGEDISKPTDDVHYVITVTNTSTNDTPTLVGSVSDSLLGDLGAISLDPGESTTINATRTVQADDPDPLVNTATVTAHADGESTATTTVTASASHSVDLFYPGISITKSANDHLVAPGDTITYTVTITNTTSNGDSGDGAPDLDITSVNDTLAGDITNLFPDTLPTGASASATYTYVVPNDWDPAVNVDNTVSVESNPVGFPNDIDASASESVNVFKPSFTITKTGEDISKPTDDVHYVITVTNTSTSDTPDMSFTLTDSLLTLSAGDSSFTLASGASKVVNVTRTVLDTDPDPLINTATATGTISGETFDTTLSASHTVDLFRPGVAVQKTVIAGPIQPVIGDTLTFRITVANLTDGDLTTPEIDGTAPDLILSSVIDTVTQNSTEIADLSADVLAALQAAGLDDLSMNETGFVDINYTLTTFGAQLNSVTVHYNPDGFPNDVQATDSIGFQVAAPVEHGRMTGGGSIFLPDSGATPDDPGLRVTHGFQLHCAQESPKGDITTVNNRLEINWGKPNNHFHLDYLTSVICLDTGIVQAPPEAPIDTMDGTGVGRFSGVLSDGTRLNNVAASIVFTLTDGGPDKGEPGLYDTAAFHIMADTDGDGTPDTDVLDTAGPQLLQSNGHPNGNHQSHPEIPTLEQSDPVVAGLLSDIDKTLNQLDNNHLSDSRIDSLTTTLLDQFDQLQAYLDNNALLAQSAGTGNGPALDLQQLQAQLQNVRSFWQNAGISAQTLASLNQLQVRISQLPGNILGLASPSTSTIWIDQNAAGYGWSVGNAPGQMNLDTVLEHEVGHVLGFHHDSGYDVMHATLSPNAAQAPVASTPAASPTILSTLITPAQGANINTLLTVQPETTLPQVSFTTAEHRNAATLLSANSLETRFVSQDTAGRLAPYFLHPQSSRMGITEASDRLFAAHAATRRNAMPQLRTEENGQESQQGYDGLAETDDSALSDKLIQQLFAGEQYVLPEQAIEQLFAGEDNAQLEKTPQFEASGVAAAAAMFGAGWLVNSYRDRRDEENRRNEQQRKSAFRQI